MSRLYCRLRWSFVGAFIVTVGVVAAGASARAEPSADDKALATMLFQEGRLLMSEGRIPEACQKLQESQRLDPGGGTILNLALCHEQEGRLARSWSEFKEALVVARRDGRRDREVEAANHVVALEPRVSRLTIVVAPGAQVEGLRIERDGREVGRGAWSTALPVDGGDHVVRATALGREPFVTKVVMRTESDARTVEIPVLATPVVVVTSSQPATAEPTTAVVTPTRLRRGGIAMAGAGVIALGAAGYVLSTAITARNDADPHCWIDGCDAVGLQRRNDAVFRGNLATLLGIGGVVLVGAGATLFYLGRRPTVATREPRVSSRFMLGAGPGTVVTGIQGGF
ncbi:MAG: hypothetical protein ABJA82_08515 [Myxococcales bacterium]